MDHAETTESEDQAPNNEIADESSLRGLSTIPTYSDGDDAPMGGNDAAAERDEGLESMDEDADDGQEDGEDVRGDDGQSSEADVTPTDTAASAPLSTTLAASTIGGPEAMKEQRQPSEAAGNDVQGEFDVQKALIDGPSASEAAVGESAAIGGEAVRSDAQLASDPMETEVPAEQSSFEQAQDMSFDEESSDVISEKASSMDAEESEHDSTAPPPQDRKDSKRSPLVDAYGPFIHPLDTSLADARERFHIAIEQTRLLRESLTDQSYERFRCIMKPVPESLDEILEPIQSDPAQAGAALGDQIDEIKAEKNMEKKQALEAGVVPEELAYFADGLHLVVLPEDEPDETEIDITQFPERGPIDPKTGDHVEEVTASAATNAEQVFDRIRRIRAFRMGGEIVPGPLPEVETQMSRSLAPNQQRLNAAFSPGFAAAPRAAASPPLSVDSDASDVDQRKSLLQHLLTLNPDAEGSRPDGSFTAVQSALYARGVGMNEMPRDFRIDPRHQRMVQPNYFSATPTHKYLPPLLGPQQLHRLHAADARREGLEVRTGVRKSVKSVVEEICSSLDEGKSAQEDVSKTDGSSGDSSIAKALGEKRSAREIGLLNRMRSAMLGNQEDKDIPAATSEGSSPGVEEAADSSSKSDFDPLLAFSVMNAVGLVRKKEGNDKNIVESKTDENPSGNAYAKALGLDNLVGLKTVSKFFNTSPPAANGKKRPIPDADDPTNESKRAKLDGYNTENGGKEDEGAYQIRGGGGEDSEKKSQKDNDVSETEKKADAPMPDGSLAGYARFDPLYNAMSSAEAASRQLLQLQLGAQPGPYQAAALAHQLPMPLGSQLSAMPGYGLAAYQSGNPASLNLSGSEQEAVRAMLLRDHHSAAAAAAHYQAAFPSIYPQNPYGFVSLPHLGSNEMQSIASLPAYMYQQMGVGSRELQRKRSSSLSEASPRKKGSVTIDLTNSTEVAEIRRPASAPPSPIELNSMTVPVAGYGVGSFALPTPPKGLRQEIADLIAHAKFHEAHSLSQEKRDESKALLITFLLSLGAAVPIPKEVIADPLVKKLSSPKYQLRLHEFVGNSSSASASRDVIVAIVSIWLWAEHQDSLKQALIESGKDEAVPSYKWLINLAIDKSLAALATFFDSHPSGKKDSPTTETPNEQVAAIASQSLSNQVFVDNRVDASFPILENLLRLLDSLREEALQVKTQERVLLAALASRCGNLSEAFSNAYVSAIVRAGVALGHENVCELVQDEECRASTMLPYDFFHDLQGAWEEPCRPTTGYYPDAGGSALKKEAHARSVIQKSMKRLQNHLRLKGGITDGGPYFPTSGKNASAPPNPAANPIVRTPSGNLKRRGSSGTSGLDAGPSESVFDPDHHVMPMEWDANDDGNKPYGEHDLIVPSPSENKKRKLSGAKDEEYRSTQELEWDDVANMFSQGNTRDIETDDDFESNDLSVKKKIFAPFVQPFDGSTLEAEKETEPDSDSDEDISDEAVLQRHQGVLDEMKLKLDAALEKRKQQSEQRGRKKK